MNSNTFSNNSLLLIHDGNQKYFNSCLHLNQIYNKVYVINKSIDKIDHDRYFETVYDLYERFSRKYLHMSTNPEWIERLCFKRYFLAYSFLITNNLESIWLIDSDLITFTDFNKLSNSLEVYKYNAALSIPSQTYEELHWSASPHCSWWSKESLLDFITFTIDTYSKNIDILYIKYNNHMNLNDSGGICDMTLLYLWSLSKNILNTSDVKNTCGYFIDHNINLPTNYDANSLYDYKFGKKYITNSDNNSILINSTGNNKYTVAALHFQGKAKICIIFLNYLPFVLISFISFLRQKIYNIFN